MRERGLASVLVPDTVQIIILVPSLIDARYFGLDPNDGVYWIYIVRAGEEASNCLDAELSTPVLPLPDPLRRLSGPLMYVQLSVQGHVCWCLSSWYTERVGKRRRDLSASACVTMLRGRDENQKETFVTFKLFAKKTLNLDKTLANILSEYPFV